MNSKRGIYLFLVLMAMPLFGGDPPPQLVITSAQVDFGVGRMYVSGKNFGSTNAPEVKLNEQVLTVMSFTDGTINAVLPAGIAPGSYILNVSRGPSTIQNDVFDVTLGAVGPKGDKGEKGDQGLIGPKGDRGDRGDQGIQGIKGDPGPQGATGAQGVAGPMGDTGAVGPAGTDGSTIPHGMAEFATPSCHDFSIPAGVTRIQVELWGAGGGGGPAQIGGSGETGGPGGGSGGYQRAILTVAPSDNYQVCVGAGGEGGGRFGGRVGDVTGVLHSNSSLLLVDGGGGGQAFALFVSPCLIQPAFGGPANSNGISGIARVGNPGGVSCLEGAEKTEGADGGLAVRGTVDPPSGNAHGGKGATGSTNAGSRGGDGYALITW